MILVVPIVQLLILPLAADYEVRNINIAIADHDHSSYSQKLIPHITSSGYFKLTGYVASYKEGYRLIEQNKADLVLEIPGGFEKDLVRDGKAKVFVAVNAINGSKAGLGANYLGRILQEHQRKIQLEWKQQDRSSVTPVIETVSSNWFNPFMSYRFFMVPGILAVLVTMIGGYMTSLNIVKEKEIGTIEQINVTPIKKHHFILGKLIPFWLIGMLIFTVGLFGVAGGVYGIWPQGNVGVLYLFLAVYLVAVLGFGLLVSTYADTQQQAMSIAFFFIMIFLLMGGLFTPIDSMPGWAQVIARANPVSYFIEVMRMAVLKGSGLKDVLPHLGMVSLFAVVLNVWAVWNYRKAS